MLLPRNSIRPIWENEPSEEGPGFVQLLFTSKAFDDPWRRRRRLPPDQVRLGFIRVTKTATNRRLDLRRKASVSLCISQVHEL